MTIKFSEIENINLPSNMYFGKGSEPTDITEFTFGTLRWSLFYCAGSGWFTIKQEKEYDEWYEIWTHQGYTFTEEKTYAEKDIIKEIMQIDAIRRNIVTAFDNGIKDYEDFKSGTDYYEKVYENK